MKIDWGHVAQLALFIGGGVACIALGQVPLGSVLIGAAAGNSASKNVVGGAVGVAMDVLGTLRGKKTGGQ